MPLLANDGRGGGGAELNLIFVRSLIRRRGFEGGWSITHDKVDEGSLLAS